jgi:NAD(P)-dependent dehydrogenase (short-subunit alcohol dehydrogenase family)
VLADGTFAGRVAVVTGGGSGIGRAIAEELARLGAHVVVVGRTREKLDGTVAAIAGTGGSAEAVALDVRDRDAVAAAVDGIVAAHGRIDHLVNSAAGNFRVAPEDMSPNAWNAVVRIVLDGTWNWTQLVGQHLLARGEGGSVLSLGSTMATQGGPDTVHSASAKAGVATMTRSLAAAWGPHGVRLNLLVPGTTEGTAGMDALHAGDGAGDPLAIVPLRRLATRRELAEAASYLLSDHASYVTGATLVVDGGRSLGQL